MAGGNSNLTLLVIRRNGLLHLALTGAQIMGDAAAAAKSWADEGFHVFLVGVGGEQWAVNHANSGRLMSSGDAAPNAHATRDGGESLKLLENEP